MELVSSLCSYCPEGQDKPFPTLILRITYLEDFTRKLLLRLIVFRVTSLSNRPIVSGPVVSSDGVASVIALVKDNQNNVLPCVVAWDLSTYTLLYWSVGTSSIAMDASQIAIGHDSSLWIPDSNAGCAVRFGCKTGTFFAEDKGICSSFHCSKLLF
jgi:hypothetical protein